MKRSQIYQCSNYNCTFNPNNLDAFSYQWWRFVAVVEGKIIFNNYRYSNSTSKHQSKVRSLMNQLGIEANIYMPLPRGIRHDQTLAELIIEAEEELCREILLNEEKREQRNERSKQRRRRLEKKLENYLENSVAFRDYDIVPREKFGKAYEPIANKIAVHQIVDAKSLERDVENALHAFSRDGFGSVVFYV